MTRSLYAAVADVERSGEPAALCTVVRARGSVPRHAGSKMLVYADGRFEGTIGGGEMESRVIAAALEVMRGGEPQLLTYALSSPAAGDPGVCGGEVEIYLEAIRPQPTILVIGGGHVGRAIVWLAHWLGQRVALSDDRPEFCTPEWAPGAIVVRVAAVDGEPFTHAVRHSPRGCTAGGLSRRRARGGRHQGTESHQAGETRRGARRGT